MPGGLPVDLFEPLSEPEAADAQRAASGLSAYADTLGMRARQQPGLAPADRDKLERMAATLRACEEVLAAWSVTANERAYTLLDRLPPARGVVLTLLRHRQPARRAACVCEAYDSLLHMRQCASPTAQADLCARIHDAIRFCDTQGEMRACIQAHRTAALVPELEHALVDDCGRCCFRVRI